MEPKGERMQTPHVRLDHDGLVRDVRPGGILGRSSSAALRIQDGRVSEAHAMVVLRGRGMQLLSLRGRLRVDGEDEDVVELESGTRVELADGISVTVAAVVLPVEVVAARLDGGPVLDLWSEAYALVRSPEPELVPGHRAGAVARLWNDGSAWMVAVGDRDAERFSPGRAWVAEGTRLEAVAVPAIAAATESTELGGDEGVEIVGRWETAHLLRRGREPVLVNGQPAQLLTELGQMGAPVGWQVVGAQLWPQVSDPDRLRKSFDRVVRRLRLTLREHGLREDLVRSTGTGSYELFLRPGDAFRDEA